MRIRFDARRHVRVALIVGLAMLAINAGFYAFVVSPRLKAYESLEGTRTEFERELASAEKRQKALASYHEKLLKTEQNAERFHKEILGTKQERSIEIQREISEIAIEFQIDPESVSMDNVDQDEAGLEKFGIEIPLEGDYKNLRNFIARVEKSRSFLIVDRISWTGTKEGGLQLLLNIGMSTYFDAPWLKEFKKSEKPTRKRT